MLWCTCYIANVSNDKFIAILGAGYFGEMIGDATIALLNRSYIPSEIKKYSNMVTKYNKLWHDVCNEYQLIRPGACQV